MEMPVLRVHDDVVRRRAGGIRQMQSRHMAQVHRLRAAPDDDQESALKCGISAPQAFFLRHKLQEAIGEILDGIALSGRVEMDGKFFRINLKGTKPENMPRPSKHRGGGSVDPNHRVMTIWAIDENDNMVAKIVGLGPESREKIDKMLPRLKGCTTLVTDDKSCYESFARTMGSGTSKSNRGRTPTCRAIR